MAESFHLVPVDRSALASPAARLARLEGALPSLLSVLAEERDAVALQSTLACLLYETLSQTLWCGFYRRTAEAMLTVGPYQGTLGCLRIPFSRGVCGAAARSGRAQRVPDVHAVADHIACDSRSRSELVLPVFDHAGELRAVLDLDSPHLDAFSEEESRALEELLHKVFRHADVQW